METAHRPGLGLVYEVVLPKPDHRPADPPQRPPDQAITCPVARDLVAPEGAVGLGLGAMVGAPVPEAGVHKHSSLLWE